MNSGAKRASEAVIRVLPSRLAASVRIVGDEGAQLVVAWESRDVVIAPVWAGQGFPRDLERALYLHNAEVPPDVVFAAKEFSAGARQILTERNLNWADEAGNASIVLPGGIYISRDAPTPVPQRNRAEGWTPAIASVAETILSTLLRAGSDPTRSARALQSVNAIAQKAHLSAGRVSEILRQFDRTGYTEKVGPRRGPGSVRFVEDSTRMLSDWAAWHRAVPVESTGMHLLWGSPREFVTRKLAPVLDSREWAVTGWLAADLIAPFVTEIPTVSVYVDREVYVNELTSIADRVGLRRVESGPRVIFMPAGPQVLEASHMLGEIRAVSPIRLYGDLLKQQGRGVDAAEHLRETTIGW
ncbi:type IV toxin-antitoxin system AbiEi family antitoxin [Salinibacterium sp. SWN1162]|uniref:type IV toxin-antitoxin system AbiEi family antitoxin n=1 Tax=Salinibacterium sp. SWN1162 TaxID=2792053 RepID=UPI0018CEB98F|nr:type IV toxin-antitoxin system AbiEi family antitoxin [Salinibacterium sp. SWN1162]MBH0008283.1 hypothetical protein [Salinibacterium sp. SWN1162]